LCEDVAAGKLEGDALDKAIDDTKKAIEELRAAGLEDEAKALEAMLEKMEAAQAAQKAADASESELKVMIMVEGGGDDDEEELDEMIDEVKSKAAKLRAEGRIAEAEEEEKKLAAAAAEAAQAEEDERKKLAAAAKIQANFRGTKAREEVKEKKESTVVQHYDDPSMQRLDVGSIKLQSTPNRGVDEGVKLTPRTIAMFNGMPNHR
jgi:hypothetical protein